MAFMPLKPIPMKERVSMVFVEYGQIDVKDGAFVVIDKNGVRIHIPVGSVACIMLEPGTRVSHAATKLAAQVGTLLVWVRELIACYIKLNWRWMMNFASRLFVKCMKCVLEKNRRSDVVLNSCAVLRAHE